MKEMPTFFEAKMMKETLIERMRHAASHCKLCCDQDWEAEQLLYGASALEMLHEWIGETDWLRFIDDHPEAIDWFRHDAINSQ